MFVIVKFPNENDAVAVVPRVWLTKNNVCLWPPYSLNSDKFKKAVQNSELPDNIKSWGTCKAEVLKIFDTYAAARKKLQKSTLTSELSDSSASDSDGSKKIQKRVLASDLPSITVKKCRSEKENHLQPYPVFGIDEVISAQRTNSNKEPNEPIVLSEVEVEDNQNSTLLKDGEECPGLDQSSAPSTSTSVNVQLVTKPLTEGKSDLILNFLADIKVRLERVEAKVDFLTKMNVEASVQEEEEFKDFPFDNYKRFESFVKMGTQENDLKKKLIGRFSSLGGRKPSLHVNSILGDLITDEVAKGYSWCGQRGNRNFSDLGLLNLIFTAVKKGSKNGSGATKAEVKELIDCWLRHAKDRINLKSKKMSSCKVQDDDMDDNLDDL